MRNHPAVETVEHPAALVGRVTPCAPFLPATSPARTEWHALPSGRPAFSLVSAIGNRKSEIGNPRAFSLVELLVVMTLLSLIVLALMAVFNSTQQAFRASVTQTDVLEGSRAAVDLLTTDLRTASPAGDYTPSLGTTNFIRNLIPYPYTAVNFFVTNNDFQYAPLVQSLPGSSAQRTNLLQWFFVLGRENTKWKGAGYIDRKSVV